MNPQLPPPEEPIGRTEASKEDSYQPGEEFRNFCDELIQSDGIENPEAGKDEGTPIKGNEPIQGGEETSTSTTSKPTDGETPLTA